MKRGLIPKAIAYAKNVKAIENHSFQAWLQQTIDREDLIWWARNGEESWTIPQKEPVGFKRFISFITP